MKTTVPLVPVPLPEKKKTREGWMEMTSIVHAAAEMVEAAKDVAMHVPDKSVVESCWLEGRNSTP